MIFFSIFLLLKSTSSGVVLVLDYNSYTSSVEQLLFCKLIFKIFNICICLNIDLVVHRNLSCCRIECFCNKYFIGPINYSHKLILI